MAYPFFNILLKDSKVWPARITEDIWSDVRASLNHGVIRLSWLGRDFSGALWGLVVGTRSQSRQTTRLRSCAGGFVCVTALLPPPPEASIRRSLARRVLEPERIWTSWILPERAWWCRGYQLGERHKSLTSRRPWGHSVWCSRHVKPWCYAVVSTG